MPKITDITTNFYIVTNKEEFISALHDREQKHENFFVTEINITYPCIVSFEIDNKSGEINAYGMPLPLVMETLQGYYGKESIPKEIVIPDGEKEY